MKNYLFIIFSVFLVSCMEEEIPTPKNEITNVNVEYSIDDGTNKENGDFVYPSTYYGRPNILELGVDSLILGPSSVSTGIFVEVPSGGSFKVVITGETPDVMPGVESGGERDMFMSNNEIYGTENYLSHIDTTSITYDSLSMEYTYNVDSIFTNGNLWKSTFETNPSSERFTGGILMSGSGLPGWFTIEYFELKSISVNTSPMYSETPSKSRRLYIGYKYE